MRIIITGGTGYIGEKLVQKLLVEQHTILLVVRDSKKINGAFWGKIQSVCVGDPALEEIIKEFQPEVYVNLAGAYSNQNDVSLYEQLWEANAIFPSKILYYFVKSGGKTHVHTSSYQQQVDGSAYAPMNFYSATKQAYENVIKLYCDNKDLKAYMLTLFDTYGEDDKRNKVFNYVRRLKDGETIEMSPGKQKLFLVYIDDVVSAYIQAIEMLNEKPEGTYFKYAIRSENPIELREFIETYLSKTRRNISVNWGGRDYLRNEIMDPSGYGVVLPRWTPKYSYAEGIEKCVREDDD